MWYTTFETLSLIMVKDSSWAQLLLYVAPALTLSQYLHFAQPVFLSPA